VKSPEGGFLVDFPTLHVALDWAEAHCVVPDGFRRGQPFVLLGWQAWCLANFYRVRPDAEWVPDNPILAPAFHYRRSQIVLPQKAGKGPYSACHVCIEGAGPALFAGWAGRDDGYSCAEHGCPCGWEYAYQPGEPMGMAWPTPLIQITGYSEESTGNVYGWLRPMIERGPLSLVIPRVSEEFIRLPGGGRVDAVSSAAQSRLGNPVTYAAQDEVGIWAKANGMHMLATTQRRGLAGMGGRAEETTNAWDPTQDTVAQRTAESVTAWDPHTLEPEQRGVLGAGRDVFRFHPLAPAHLSYTDRRERRRIHRYVYGSSLRDRGGHIDLDAIEAEAFELLSTDPTEAERFFGNRAKSGMGSWLPDGLWDSRAAHRDVAKGTRLVLGFDGSESEDWTGIRAETIDGYGFTPLYGPDQRPCVWNPADYNGRIPHTEITAAVDELMRRYRVIRMYCDPRGFATDIEGWALTWGGKIVFEWATNRISAMHECLVRVVADLREGTLTHDGDPVTALHVGNARKLARPGERYILGKPKEHMKIDLAMCAALAHEARCDAVAAGEGRAVTRRRVVVMN
jgi:hypothetical protein